MNMFQTDKPFLGEYDLEHRPALSDLFQLVREVQDKLGKKKYFLKQYLSSIFCAANTISAFDAAEYGMSVCRELRSLCLCAVQGKESDDPFFQTVKQRLQDHPMGFQESATRIHLLHLSLYDQYLSSQIPLFIQEQESSIRELFEKIVVSEWYQSITQILGSGEPMQQLNRMIQQHFLISPILSSFLQGCSDDLLGTLLCRDYETNQYAFQLFADTLDTNKG